VLAVDFISHAVSQTDALATYLAEHPEHRLGVEYPWAARDAETAASATA